MEQEILTVNELGIQLTEWALPIMAAMFLVVATLWFKDLAASIARGLMFRFDSNFNEGDVVMIDGDLATIIKMGMTQTVFEIIRDGSKSWRYVSNERIDSVKLEKVIHHEAE